MSQPVKTQLGYHIIKLEGMKTGAYVPFPEVKDFIRQKLTQEKQAEVLQKYIEELKKKSKIVINEDMLKEEARAGEAPAKPQDASKVEPGTATAPEASKTVAPAAPGTAAPAKTEAGPKK